MYREKKLSFANRNKDCKIKIKYWEKKFSFANRNKELQKLRYNSSMTVVKEAYELWFYFISATHFPCSHLLIHLQRSIYFAFQSSVSSRYRFPFALHFSVHFTSWHCFDVGGGVKKLGRVQQAWARPLEATSLAGDVDRNRFESQHGCHESGSWSSVHSPSEVALPS